MSAQIKERPVLFSGEMIRATLDGRKTQTRRPLRPQPKHDARYTAQPQRLVYTARSGWEGVMWDPWQLGHPRPGYEHVAKLNPLGVPGDLLYVRETWCGHWGPILDGMREPERWLTDARIPQDDGTYSQATPDNPLSLYYRATWGDEPPLSHIKWRSSIHMFKWAARLWLVNTGVRVERVQDISYDDILAEGLGEPPFVDEHETHIAFAELWDSIYAKKGLGWDVNPFVFATSYKVTER